MHNWPSIVLVHLLSAALFHQRCKQLDESLARLPRMSHRNNGLHDDTGRLMTGFNAIWFTLHWHETFTDKTSWPPISNWNEGLVDFFSHFLLSIGEREVTCGLSKPDHLQEHQSGINHISSSRGLDPSISPSTPCWDGPPNQIPATMFYISPQFQILPTVSDSTHWCFRFVALFPSPTLCDQMSQKCVFLLLFLTFLTFKPCFQFK